MFGFVYIFFFLAVQTNRRFRKIFNIQNRRIYFLQLLDGAPFLAFFQSSGQIGIFLFEFKSMRLATMPFEPNSKRARIYLKKALFIESSDPSVDLFTGILYHIISYEKSECFLCYKSQNQILEVGMDKNLMP